MKIIDLLLDHGAEIDARDVDHGATPAQYKVRDRELCRHLIARGAAVDIFMACGLGDLALLRSVLDKDPTCTSARIGDDGYPPVPSAPGGHIYQNAHARAPSFSSGDEALRTCVWYNGSMKVRRGYRFKLKPTPETEHAFVLMAGHARFLWNKALRLNLGRLAGGVPILWYNDLCGLLHLWKQSEEYGFLAEANAQVLQQKCKDLCRAFSAAFDPTQPGKRLPRFKKRGVDDAFRFPQGVRIDNRRVYLPKVGWVGFFWSRGVAGTIKSATVSREADGWYVSILTEITLAKPAPHPGPCIGVDRGVAVFAVTSAGELVAAVNEGERRADRMRHLQRQLARQRKGSKNRAKTKRRIARLHQSIARGRADFLHKLSTRWSQSHALIVLEDLRIGNLTRSAKGTVAEPGRNVAAKSGLNRAILDQGWGAFAEMLGYKLTERGGQMLLVAAHHSSQTCSVCGHVAPSNRPTRKEFRCVACGHAEHADVNAAKVILQRGLAA